MITIINRIGKPGLLDKLEGHATIFDFYSTVGDYISEESRLKISVREDEEFYFGIKGRYVFGGFKNKEQVIEPEIKVNRTVWGKIKEAYEKAGYTLVRID
jgi:hypothetical protein